MKVHEIAERWAFEAHRSVNDILALLSRAVRDGELAISDVAPKAPVTNVDWVAGKRQEYLDWKYGLVSRKDFALWYSSRRPALDLWWAEEAPGMPSKIAPAAARARQVSKAEAEKQFSDWWKGVEKELGRQPKSDECERWSVKNSISRPWLRDWSKARRINTKGGRPKKLRS